MKNRFFLGLTSLMFLLVLSTSSTYALTEEFQVTAESGNFPTFYELNFINKGGSYVTLHVEVLELELDICSVSIVDNYQRVELRAIIQFYADHTYLPWEAPTAPSGSYTYDGITVYYSELEPIEVYLGATNLTLNSERSISGYLGPLSEQVVTNNITTNYDYRYFILLESSILSSTPFRYAKIWVKYVSTLPAPSAVATIVVLASISFFFYRRRKKLKS